MKTKPSHRKNPFGPPLVRRFGEGLLIVASLLLAQGAEAEILQVPDGENAVQEVGGKLPAKSNRKIETSVRDLQVVTGKDASSSLRFPCGMSWQVHERSRLTLLEYKYDGLPCPADSVRIDPKSSALQGLSDNTTMARGVTAWRAELQEGVLEIAAPHSRAQSRNVLVTPEVELNLHSLSLLVRRDPQNGTIIDLISGQAEVTLKDGSHLTLSDGFRLVLTPDGGVKMDRLLLKDWVLVPAAPTPEAGSGRNVIPAGFTMPERPEDVVFVSVS